MTLLMPKIPSQSNPQRIRPTTYFTYKPTRVNPTSSPRSVKTSSRITPPAQLQLSADQKLELLRQLDRWRPWRSLDDQRLCLGCGRLMTGHDIDAMHTESDDQGSIEVHCPTPGCQSIPLDWILPNPRAREVQF